MQQDIVNDHQEEAQGWKWEQIKEIIESGELARLKRSRQMTDKYHEHKKRTAGLDMNQYVLQKLGWSLDEPQLENAAAKAFSSSTLYAVRANDFRVTSSLVLYTLFSGPRLPCQYIPQIRPCAKRPRSHECIFAGTAATASTSKLGSRGLVCQLPGTTKCCPDFPRSRAAFLPTGTLFRGTGKNDR